jgi:hypothetical protein
MDLRYVLRLAKDYVTFGRGIHYLLQVLTIQVTLVFLDVRFLQIARPDLLSGREGPVFTALFLTTAVVFMGILWVFVNRMGRQTLSTRFHSYPHLVISTFGYITVSGVVFVIYFGILLTIGSQNAAQGRDYLTGFMFTTLFAAFLAIGYHSRVVSDDYPGEARTKEVVAEWFDSLDWVNEPQGSHVRNEEYELFLEKTEKVAELLDRAHTIEGKQLQADFLAWYENFLDRSELTREKMIRGDNTNSRLQRQHEDLKSVLARLSLVAGVQV